MQTVAPLLTGLALTVLLLLPSKIALASDVKETALTVYSSADPTGFDPQQILAQVRSGHVEPQLSLPGFGVVKQEREVQLVKGRNVVRFGDVAARIDPTSVSFTDLTDEKGTQVLAQRFEFDLASPQRILERYVGEQVSLREEEGDSARTVEGRVLAVVGGQVILNTKEGVRFVPTGSPDLRLPALPQGLVVEPTLVWELQAAGAGPHRIRTTYQTEGLSWRADYNLVLNEAESAADLSAWVTLLNLSGASYHNTRLKLVAGDVQRVQPRDRPAMLRMRAEAMVADAGGGFEEKSFFEYHLYTLPRRVDLPERSTQQLVLFPDAHEVKVEKNLVYDGAQLPAVWRNAGGPLTDRAWGVGSNEKVDVYLSFENRKANNLGVPLPKGKVRVFKEDRVDGTLEFVGEDVIDHTPRDEQVRIKIGQAFDVVGERTQTDFSVDSRGREIQETYRITVKNRKDQPQMVRVAEHLYRWSSWEITSHSEPFERLDARTVHFPLKLAAGQERTITYTVRYRW